MLNYTLRSCIYACNTKKKRLINTYKIILKYNEHKFVILNRLRDNKAIFHKLKNFVAMNNLEFT